MRLVRPLAKSGAALAVLTSILTLASSFGNLSSTMKAVPPPLGSDSPGSTPGL
jgi:hypothetical protein